MTTSRTVVLLTVGMTLSLCLNAFLIGGWVAHKQGGWRGDRPHMQRMVNGGEEGQRPRDMMRPAMKKFLERIPDEDKGPLQRAMEEAKPLVEEKMKVVEGLRKTSFDLVKAEPFDSAKLAEALAAQRVAQSDVQTTVHAAIVKALEQMTPEQRERVSRMAKRLFL